MGRKIKYFTFILSYPRLVFALFPPREFIERSRVYAVENTIAYGEITFLRENEFSHCVNVRDINFTK